MSFLKLIKSGGLSLRQLCECQMCQQGITTQDHAERSHDQSLDQTFSYEFSASSCSSSTPSSSSPTSSVKEGRIKQTHTLRIMGGTTKCARVMVNYLTAQHVKNSADDNTAPSNDNDNDIGTNGDLGPERSRAGGDSEGVDNNKKAAIAVPSFVMTDKRVLEVGSGTGLVGMCMSKLGARTVFVTDQKPMMDTLHYNIELNVTAGDTSNSNNTTFESGVRSDNEYTDGGSNATEESGRIIARPLQWGKHNSYHSLYQKADMNARNNDTNPPDVAGTKTTMPKFDYVIGSDLIFAHEGILPLVETFKAFCLTRKDACPTDDSNDSTGTIDDDTKGNKKTKCNIDIVQADDGSDGNCQDKDVNADSTDEKTSCGEAKVPVLGYLAVIRRFDWEETFFEAMREDFQIDMVYREEDIMIYRFTPAHYID